MEEVDNLRDTVIGLINVDETLTQEEVTNLVNHLFSPAVMLRSVKSFEKVDESVLVAGGIGLLPARNIATAFQLYATKTSEPGHSSTREPEPQPVRREVEDSDDDESQYQRLVFRDDEFNYTINWNDMPKKTLKNLDMKNREKKEGSTGDIVALKTALGVKMVSKYEAFCKAHPSVTQTSPGWKACEDVARQAVGKYRKAMRDMLNGVKHGNGVLSFAKLLNTKTQNDTRKPAGEKTTRGVSKGKGWPGVLPDEHQPPMTRAEKLSQKRTQKALQEMATFTDPDNLDWGEITADMQSTFELQREHIVEYTKSIINNDDKSNSDEEDTPQEKVIIKLKEGWPLLFTLKPLHNHHKRLTGRNLEERLNKFIGDPDNLKFLLLFMTSCSSSNINNVILNETVKQSSANLTSGAQLLLTICMLANHFKEDYKTLLMTAERTTTLDEVLAAVPNLPSSICIVSLGDNPFAAHNHYICVDQVGVTETSNAGNAILMLIELCFILNVEYPPKMAHTFEFIERIILEMTPLETRVRNTKGKILLVLTDAIKKTAEKLIEFTNQLKENIGAAYN